MCTALLTVVMGAIDDDELYEGVELSSLLCRWRAFGHEQIPATTTLTTLWLAGEMQETLLRYLSSSAPFEALGFPSCYEGFPLGTRSPSNPCQ